MGQSKRIRVNEDGEREKRCSRCGEWWPADKEFFYGGNGPGRLHCWCKACYKDAHNSRRRKGRIKKIGGRPYKVMCPNIVDIIREVIDFYTDPGGNNRIRVLGREVVGRRPCRSTKVDILERGCFSDSSGYDPLGLKLKCQECGKEYFVFPIHPEKEPTRVPALQNTLR